MKIKPENRKNYINNIWLIFIGLVCIPFVLGCSNNYGRLAVNGDVKSQFEKYQILPDHSYYYSGSKARPRAVIGIHKDYTLDSKFWNPIELTSNQLKRWVNYFGPHSQYVQPANGSDILSDQGERIGVWYAFIDWRDWVRVEMVAEKIVNISKPIERNPKIRLKFYGSSKHE